MSEQLRTLLRKRAARYVFLHAVCGKDELVCAKKLATAVLAAPALRDAGMDSLSPGFLLRVAGAELLNLGLEVVSALPTVVADDEVEHVKTGEDQPASAVHTRLWYEANVSIQFNHQIVAVRG